MEEKAFISCLLNRPELINAVNKIKPSYLTDTLCRDIYSEILKGNFSLPLIAKNTHRMLEDIIEIQEIVALPNKTTVNGYAYYIFEQYKKNKIKNLLSQNVVDISAIEQIQKETYIEDEQINESEEYLKNAEQRFRGQKDERNIPTGFFNLDDKIEGFRKSEAVFIGGRPASGKTTFGINVAYNMAKDGHKVLFCSIEMGIIELHERLVKHITQLYDYRSMSESDFEKIIKTSKAVKERLPLIIYDKAGMTIEDIVFKARESAAEVVFIDHLAILKSSQSFKSRYEEVSYLSARIKQLARELDIPVICLCQLNRNLESREIKAPTMSDIRDSGSVEQDADIIGFVYRPEYHLREREPDNKNSNEYLKWQEDLEAVKGKAQLIIAKNRRGLTDRFSFKFEGKTFSFFEL